jgi:hypothetical protein
MDSDVMRTQVAIPKRMIQDIDDLVGRQQRDKFLVEAVEEKLRRIRQRAALEKAAGALSEVDVPGWETPNAAVDWVNASRHADDPADFLSVDTMGTLLGHSDSMRRSSP